jgi:sugar lactone lactonase YvrE
VSVEVTVIAPEQAKVGESPVWDERLGRLLWTDIPRGTIHEWDAASGARRQWTFDASVGSFGLCESGRLVVACKDRVLLFDRDTGAQSELARVTHAREGMQFNDGKVGPDGAFWVGSTRAPGMEEALSALYRVSPDGAVRTVTEGLMTSNGLAWSGDGRTMIHTDSKGQWIDVLDFDPATGAATNRRRLREMSEAEGRPDGGAFDIEGYYWSAGISAGRLNRISMAGEIVTSIELPLPHPTMPCFGGPDGLTLYVTSLSSDAERAANALSGAVIALPAPLRGVPVTRFQDR